jgi:hypothetical protein
MKTLHSVFAILAAVVLIGFTGATLQQTSAIIDNWKEEFRVLTDQFEDAISGEVDHKPINNETIRMLVDDYKTNLTGFFENSTNLNATG